MLTGEFTPHLLSGDIVLNALPARHFMGLQPVVTFHVIFEFVAFFPDPIRLFTPGEGLGKNAKTRQV